MTKSRRHEIDKTLIARLLEVYAPECDGALTGVGEETLQDEAQRRSARKPTRLTSRASRLLPDFDLDTITRIVLTTRFGDDQTEVVRAYRDALRTR